MREAIVALDFDGYAIGGVSVGEPEPEMMKASEVTEPFLPANKARYAMGLGTPAQLVELAARGVDMFDLRSAHRVSPATARPYHPGTVSIKAGSTSRLSAYEEGCECFACRHFTRAYLGPVERWGNPRLRMVSVHNSHMFLKVMADIRGPRWPPARLPNSGVNSSPIIFLAQILWP